MEYENLGTPIKETIEELKTYVEDLITYNKLVFAKGASQLSSILIMLVVLFGISGFVLLFFSFAFAGWFETITGLSIGTGYLVIALFYVLLGFLVYRFRNPLIFNPSRKLFGEIFFGDDNNNEFKFDTEEVTSENIKKVHEQLADRKESLNKKVKNLEKQMTFANIFQEIIGKAYNSIVTTSNIAKFAFTIVRSLKGITGKKKRKAKKNKHIDKKKDTD